MVGERPGVIGMVRRRCHGALAPVAEPKISIGDFRCRRLIVMSPNRSSSASARLFDPLLGQCQLGRIHATDKERCRACRRDQGGRRGRLPLGDSFSPITRGGHRKTNGDLRDERQRSEGADINVADGQHQGHNADAVSSRHQRTCRCSRVRPARLRSNATIDSQDTIDAAFVPPRKRPSDIRHTLTVLPRMLAFAAVFG
jgi:hypothetical protein